MSITETDFSGKILPLLSPSDIGRLLGISRRQVLRLPIKQVRLGPKTIRFRKEDYDAYVKAQAN